MNYRRLGKTELKVSEVGLGALELGAAYGIGQECGEVPSEEETQALLKGATDVGITLFDTAGCYGLSEYRIGRFVRGMRQRPVITTKLMVQETNDGQYLDYATEKAYPSVRACVDHQVERSLRNLCVDAIDLMQLHGLPDGALFDEMTAALQAHVKAGRIRHLGASCGGQAIPKLAERGYCTAQLCYNLLDQTERRAGLELARQHDFGVLIRIPLALGILADKVERLDAERRARFEPFLDDLRARLPKGMTIPEAALRFVLSSLSVSACIPGTRRLRHLRQNAWAGDGWGLPAPLYEYLCRLSDEGKLPQWSWNEHYKLDWPKAAHEKNLQYCRSVDC